MDNYKTQFQHGTEYVAKYRIDDEISFEEELERIAELTRGFADQYKKERYSDKSVCVRKGMQIGFDADIPFLNLLRIIDLAPKNDLVYDCSFSENRLNFYIKCTSDDFLAVPYSE